MKNIVIAGGNKPLLMAYEYLSVRFKIIGFILDDKKYSLSALDDKIKTEKIKIYNWYDINELSIDCIFVINYSKIIDLKKIHNIFIINLHIGILPKYRGINANAWAILNDEKYVGYTIHEINSELDGGDIFYTFHYEIKPGETYHHAKIAINFDIKSNLSKVLYSILLKKVKRVSPHLSKFVYWF